MDRRRDKLVVGTVVEDLMTQFVGLELPGDAQNKKDTAGEELLKRLWRCAKQHGVADVELLMARDRRTVHVLCKMASLTEPEFILVGRHGHKDWFHDRFGSISKGAEWRMKPSATC
jgi:hypothetical protein